MRDNLYNTNILVRLILRRERFASSMWILLIAGICSFLAPTFGAMMDDASRQAILPALENPAMIAMMGPIIGADNFTQGAMFTTFMLLFTAVAVVVMNIMLVVRHTRADEEKGRYEVVRSLPTGRLAHLNAALIVAVLVNTLLAVITGLGLFLLGDGSMCLNGSMLWGALLGSVGLLFAAIAAVFSQLSASSKGAMGYSLFLMAAFYLIRAIGDTGANVLSVISPLGLILQAEAYVGNYWWPVPVLIIISIPVALLAYRLNLTRDIDQGILPDRQGRAEGGVMLATPFGLSLKLCKTGLIVGLLSIFALGASYGMVMGDIDGFLEANEFYQQLILWIDGVSLPLLFAGMINFMGALMALIPMLLYVLRARGEEKDNRAELVLAAPVSRYKFLGGYVIISFVSSVFLQFLTGFGMWLTASAVLPNPDDFPLAIVIRANLAYLPAVWVMIGLTIFLIGVLPKFAGFIWAVFGAVFFLGMFGRMDIFPGWVQNISPFGFIPQYPMESLSLTPMLVLTIIAAGLTVAGFVGFRQRDIKL